MKYKGWNIEYNPKPISESVVGYWDFWHENNDGEDPIWSGCEASEQCCKDEIDDRIYELYQLDVDRASKDLKELVEKWGMQGLSVEATIEASLWVFVMAALKTAHSKECFLDTIHEIIEEFERLKGLNFSE